MSPEVLTVHAARLRSFIEHVDAVRWRLVALQAASWTSLALPDVPDGSRQTSSHLTAAHLKLGMTSVQAGMLANALDLAAENYGAVERANDAAMKQMFGQYAYWLGVMHPIVLTLLVAPVGGVAAWVLSSRAEAIDDLAEHQAALSDPRVVDLVRYVVMSVDEFGAGVVKVPPILLPLLGDEALGILGLSGSAATLGALGKGAGFMRETPVAVTKTAVESTPAANGLAENIERVPVDSEQIRIEQITVPGEPDRYVVYVGGTRDGAIGASDEPFDMTSNVGGLAMGDPGSVRAVEAAMRAAGITSENPVQLVGYSQGGLVGAQVASTGEWNVQALLTAGAPIGQIPVPEDVFTVALEHSDDLVPALGGTWASNDAVVVSRRAFAEGEVPDTSVLPAHELTQYRDTADLADGSLDTRLVAAQEVWAEFTAGATSVESSLWHAKRVKAPPVETVYV